MRESDQLTLDLIFRPSLRGEDFFVAPCNASAVAWLDHWPDWPAPALLLYGPPGCGKTHLASVFLARTGGTVISWDDTNKLPPNLFGNHVALVIEKASQWVQRGQAEFLLHLYNTARDMGRFLLLTDRQPPARWKNMKLADLASRLKAIPAIEIGPPDDKLIQTVLNKLFSDRQISVEQDVLSYLGSRMERTFESARSLVAAIDATALAEQRHITVPLVRKVLAKMTELEIGEVSNSYDV